MLLSPRNQMNNYPPNGEARRPDISLVILCYKAGESIRQFYQNAVKVFVENGIFDYELVLVGNYHDDSDDETPRVVSELAKQNQKVICVAKIKEGMMGWDMKSGLSAARGKHIAVIDGDGQMPLEDIITVYNKIKSEKLDLVKTYRVERGDSRWRKIISGIYNLFFGLLFPGFYSTDVNSKPKIFTRSAYEKLDLVSNGWFIDAEIMIQARRLHLKIGEVPTHFLGLSGNRRSFVRFSAIAEFIKNLIIFRLKEFKYWFK